MASVQDVSPLDRLNREFIEAVREIMYLAIKIDSPYGKLSNFIIIIGGEIQNKPCVSIPPVTSP